MPTLQFKGKSLIWNHHMSVPYHTLEKDDSLGYHTDKSGGNLLIEGDNLTALKALLPQYANSVKCIYIDPPYNTGNEGWVYNDKVNSPMIKEWLGQAVGKEDMTRHDKWLCMMTPRLKLLRELLSDDGVIFVSIDDNETYLLRQLMDEIFSEFCYKNTIAVRRGIKSVQSQFENIDKLALGHEYVLCYTRNDIRLPKLLNQLKDEKAGKWDTFWRGTDRSTMRYPLFGQEPQTGQWRWEPERANTAHLNYQTYLEQAASVMSLDEYFVEHVTATGEKLDFIRLNDDNVVQYYVTPKSYRLMSDNWMDISIRGSETDFETEKSVDIVYRCINWITGNDKDAIILDSFAGSGTTGHAVMELNKEDGGNRQCIMVQMRENSPAEPDKNNCRDITRERLVRSIDKYGYESGFEYLRVGQAIDAETLLGGELPDYRSFAKYVYYLATGAHIPDESIIDEASFFVGATPREAYYLIYQQDMGSLSRLALNLERAEGFKNAHPTKKVIVYAPACFIDEELLKSMNVEFVSIPYALFSRNG